MRRLAPVLAAAAVLIGVVAVFLALAGRPADRGQAAPPGASSSAPVAPAPRLLIRQSGWKAINANGFSGPEGSITWAKGPLNLEFTWYPGQYYRDYYRDRLEVSKPDPITVDSWAGNVFTYNTSDFEAMLEARDGVFVGIRSTGNWTRATFDDVLAHTVRVDEQTWLNALSSKIIGPDRIRDAAATVLADIPLPPNFDTAALDNLGVNDQYQFSAGVTSRVGCAWIAELERARTAGDDAAAARAADALRGSHQWKALKEMKDEGDWPEVFWMTVDKVVAGDPPSGYARSLGCA
jgi:hypothetical protein